jgi:hypothetical protein
VLGQRPHSAELFQIRQAHHPRATAPASFFSFCEWFFVICWFRIDSTASNGAPSAEPTCNSTRRSVGQFPRRNHERFDIVPFPYEAFGSKSDFTTDEGTHGPVFDMLTPAVRARICLFLFTDIYCTLGFMVGYHIDAVSTPLLAIGGSLQALRSSPRNDGNTIAQYVFYSHDSLPVMLSIFRC